jgi:hypothetical protein
VGLQEPSPRRRTFRLADDAPVVWKGGPIRGPKAMRLVFA